MKNFTRDELRDKNKRINDELESKGLVTISFLRIEDEKVKFFTNALKGTVGQDETNKVREVVRKHLT